MGREVVVGDGSEDLSQPLLSAASEEPGARVTARSQLSSPTDHDETPSGADEPPKTWWLQSSLALGSITLMVILIGVSVVCLVAVFPIVLGATTIPHLARNTTTWNEFEALRSVVALWTMVILYQPLHLRLLWRSALYLSFFRTMLLPFRKLILPLVILVGRIEAIRQQEAMHYLNVSSTTATATTNAATTNTEIPELGRLKKSVRRRYRHMERIFREHRIHHKASYAERSLRLCDTIPILWNHQKRTSFSIDEGATSNEEATKPQSVMEQFVKRFLVITCVPDGVLDLYYNQENELCAFQFSILQGKVWHWFSYYCKDAESKSGIWWHGTLLAILRGYRLDRVDYVNAHFHQSISKQNAGFQCLPAVNNEQNRVVHDIYPWNFTRRIPQQAKAVEIWAS